MDPGLGLARHQTREVGILGQDDPLLPCCGLDMNLVTHAATALHCPHHVMSVSAKGFYQGARNVLVGEEATRGQAACSRDRVASWSAA